EVFVVQVAHGHHQADMPRMIVRLINRHDLTRQRSQRMKIGFGDVHGAHIGLVDVAQQRHAVHTIFNKRLCNRCLRGHNLYSRIFSARPYRNNIDRITRPKVMSRIAGGTCTILSALSSRRIRITPAMVPMYLPEPPRIDVPPTTTAAIAGSRNGSPISLKLRPAFPAIINPASAFMTPLNTNAPINTRGVRTPDKNVAISLLPTA